MKSIQRRFAPVVIIVAIFASLSCSFGPAAPTDSKPPKSAAQATADAVEAIATAAAQQAKVTPTVSQSEPASPTQSLSGAAPELNNLRNNTDLLASYRMAMTLNGKGKDDQGKPVNQVFSFAQDVVKSKNAVHFIISGLGSMVDPTVNVLGGNFDFYQLDKQAYLYTKKQDDKDASCMSFGSDDSSPSTNDMDPTEMMKDIQTDKLIRKGETVNGVKADHYTVIKSTVDFGTATSESGEAWIAQEGGYLVKFTGTADGAFSFSDKFTGTMTWTYDLTDVNKDFAIELPPECADQQQSIADIPMPDNATKVGNLGTIITFSSPDAPDIVAKYFRDNLSAKGWTLKDDNSLGTLVTMTIEKGGKSLSVMITPGENDQGSSVIITPAK